MRPRSGMAWAALTKKIHEDLIDLRRTTFDQRQLAVTLVHPALYSDLVPNHVEGAVEAGMEIDPFHFHFSGAEKSRKSWTILRTGRCHRSIR